MSPVQRILRLLWIDLIFWISVFELAYSYLIIRLHSRGVKDFQVSITYLIGMIYVYDLCGQIMKICCANYCSCDVVIEITVPCIIFYRTMHDRLFR